MKRFVLGLLGAAFLHLLILLFGGIFFLKPEKEAQGVTVQDVDVLDEEKAKEPEKPREPEPPPEIEATQEQPPDLTQLAVLEPEPPSLADSTPELSALSLSSLESALDPGAAGGSDFGPAGSLASGGRIGGTGGQAGADGPARDTAFSLAELDQAARPLLQTAPAYPADLRQRKVEGVVTVLFLVDPEGRVVDPTVERSSDPGFERPALDAVRRWKFEPAVRAGKKVLSKLRVPIRFSLSS